MTDRIIDLSSGEIKILEDKPDETMQVAENDVVLPTSGEDRVIDLESGKYVSELAEIQKAEAEKAEQEEAEQERLIQTVAGNPNEGSIVSAVTEPLGQVVTGIGGTILGGLEMLGRSIVGDVDEAVAEGRKTQQAISEIGAPKTEMGKAGMEVLSEALSAPNRAIRGWAGIGELLVGTADSAEDVMKRIEEKGVPRIAGEKTLEVTGSPLLATMVEASPEIAGGIFARSKMVGESSRAKAANELELVEKIKTGAPDADVAQYRLTMRDRWQEPSAAEIGVLAEKLDTDPQFAEALIEVIPKVEKSKAYKPAIKQNWDHGLLNMVKTSSKSDIDAMNKMVDIYEAGTKNPALKVANRPIFESGKALEPRIKFLLSKKRNAGRRVESASKAMRGEKIDHGNIIENFVEKLKDEGVVFNGGKPITSVKQYGKVDFKDSLFEGSASSQKEIKEAISRLTRGGDNIDGFALHNFKKKLQSSIRTGKRSEGGLDPKAEFLLNDLQREVNDTLRTHSNDYRVANDDFITAITPLNKFNDVMPESDKINWDGINPDKAGLQTRKILSNYGNAVDMADAISDIDKVTRQLGGRFDGDVVRQAIFAINLDKRLGAFADQSFQGLQQSAGAQVIDAAMSPTNAAVQAGKSFFNRARRIDNERAIRAMREYLAESKIGK